MFLKELVCLSILWAQEGVMSFGPNSNQFCVLLIISLYI